LRTQQLAQLRQVIAGRPHSSPELPVAVLAVKQVVEKTEERMGFADFWRNFPMTIALRVVPLIRFLLCLCIPFSLAVDAVSAADLDSASAEDVSAAFIYNFARFVTWPPAAFRSDEAPIRIGFLSAAPLAKAFAAHVDGLDIVGRKLVVVGLSSPDAAASCQVVFVGDISQCAAVVRTTAGKAILTVGESDAFLAQGGMIALLREGSRMQFAVRQDALTGSGLKADAKLLHAGKSAKKN